MPARSPAALEPPAKPPPGLNRPLGPTEAIYCLLDQLYCLNFVVFAEVNGNLDAPGLEHALKAVQVEQPLLRTQLAVVRGRACFKAVAPEQAPLIAQVRPLRNWRAAVAVELDAPFSGGGRRSRASYGFAAAANRWWRWFFITRLLTASRAPVC